MKSCSKLGRRNNATSRFRMVHLPKRRGRIVTSPSRVSTAVVEICGFTKQVVSELTSVVTVAMVSRGNCSRGAKQVTAGAGVMHSNTDAGPTCSITGAGVALVTASAGATNSITGAVAA